MEISRITWIVVLQILYLPTANPIALISNFNSLVQKLGKVCRWEKIDDVVLMNLSAFNSTSHTLVTAKMCNYGLSINVISFSYSYWKRQNQNVRINKNHSVFKVLFLRFSTWSTSFQYIYDLYLWITKTDLLNFADDNTVSSAERTIELRKSSRCWMV